MICSVFRITSSVLGKLELGAGSVSSGMDPSPCQMTLRCRPFLPDLQGAKQGLARGHSSPLSPPSCVSRVTAPTLAPPAPQGWWGCHSHSRTRCSASPALKPARNRFTSARAGTSSSGLCQSHVLCTWICSSHNSSCITLELLCPSPHARLLLSLYPRPWALPPQPHQPLDTQQDRTDRAQHPSLPLKLPQGHTPRGHQEQKQQKQEPEQ